MVLGQNIQVIQCRRPCICATFSTAKEKKQSYLLASGSAICGGTAIAVVAPIIKAKPEVLITAMSIVFILNALAVILFPIMGSWMNLGGFQEHL